MKIKWWHPLVFSFTYAFLCALVLDHLSLGKYTTIFFENSPIASALVSISITIVVAIENASIG